jgi:hypothetical protein
MICLLEIIIAAVNSLLAIIKAQECSVELVEFCMGNGEL